MTEKENEITMRIADISDEEKVLALYHSAIGSQYSVWDMTYPGIDEIRTDTKNGVLYLFEKDGKLVGAVSEVYEKELDGEECWQIKENVCEIGRICVSEDFRGMGYSSYIVGRVLYILKEKGFGAVHLSAAEKNIPANRTYLRLGFIKRGEDDIFGHHFNLYEMNLEELTKTDG